MKNVFVDFTFMKNIFVFMKIYLNIVNTLSVVVARSFMSMERESWEIYFQVDILPSLLCGQ